MGSLREFIIKVNDAFTDWVINRPLRREKDPQKRFEIKLWLEISGAFLGGQARDGAWTNYKRYYYDNLPSDEDKIKVQSALLSMLRANDIPISKKAIIAHVCADLMLKDALQEAENLLKQPMNFSDQKMLSLACEALNRGITVRKLIDEKFQKGERM
jgi:hypothetical protein